MPGVVTVLFFLKWFSSAKSERDMEKHWKYQPSQSSFSGRTKPDFTRDNEILWSSLVYLLRSGSLRSKKNKSCYCPSLHVWCASYHSVSLSIFIPSTYFDVGQCPYRHSTHTTRWLHIFNSRKNRKIHREKLLIKFQLNDKSPFKFENLEMQILLHVCTVRTTNVCN